MGCVWMGLEERPVWLHAEQEPGWELRWNPAPLWSCSLSKYIIVQEGERVVTSCSCAGGCVNMAVVPFLLFVPCVSSVWGHLGDRSWVKFAAAGRRRRCSQRSCSPYVPWVIHPCPVPTPIFTWSVWARCTTEMIFFLLFSLAWPDLECSQGLLKVEDSEMERV